MAQLDYDGPSRSTGGAGRALDIVAAPLQQAMDCDLHLHWDGLSDHASLHVVYAPQQAHGRACRPGNL
eukprot:6576531-Prorocentrum_lima.AAC.1